MGGLVAKTCKVPVSDPVKDQPLGITGPAGDVIGADPASNLERRRKVTRDLPKRPAEESRAMVARMKERDRKKNRY